MRPGPLPLEILVRLVEFLNERTKTNLRLLMDIRPEERFKRPRNFRIAAGAECRSVYQRSSTPDVPAIQAISLAEGVQATTNVLQRIGRGMRPKDGGRNEVLVADFVPTCWPKGWEHAESRAATYEAEGYEVRVVESWPKFSDKGDHPDLLPFKEWE